MDSLPPVDSTEARAGQLLDELRELRATLQQLVGIQREALASLASIAEPAQVPYYTAEGAKRWVVSNMEWSDGEWDDFRREVDAMKEAGLPPEARLEKVKTMLHKLKPYQWDWVAPKIILLVIGAV